MQSALSIKREILFNLRRFGIVHRVISTTGQIVIASMTLSFDGANNYVIAHIPTNGAMSITISIAYSVFEVWFDKLFRFYTRLNAGRYNLLPIQKVHPDKLVSISPLRFAQSVIEA